MKRITVVDDDKDICRIVQHRLTSMGMDVDAYFDGKSGLAAIIANPPDLSIIEAGRVTVEMAETDLRPVVAAALELIHPQAAERDLCIANRCQSESAHIFIGDADRARQIIANLLSNAVKFTPAGGRIEHGRGNRGKSRGLTAFHAPEPLRLMAGLRVQSRLHAIGKSGP